MDVAIHELGREMLEDRMDEQREAAVLKPVRSPTDKKPPGGRRRERYEPSAGELAAALSSQLRIGSEPLLGPGEQALCPHFVFLCKLAALDMTLIIGANAQVSETSSEGAAGQRIPSYVVSVVARDSVGLRSLCHAMHDGHQVWSVERFQGGQLCM